MEQPPKANKPMPQVQNIDKRGEKNKYISQVEVPKYALEDALKVAQALCDNFGGRNASSAPHQLAVALDVSPTSTNWQFITGAAMAYGLTNGGYNAQSISLAELGKRITAPLAEGDDTKAKVEAVLKTQICKKFFEKYNRAKFPQDNIAKNMLQDWGVPNNRLDEVLKIVKRNGKFVGLITETKTGPFVALDLSSASPQQKNNFIQEETEQENRIPEDLPIPQKTTTKNTRVFISHGKDKSIMSQLKELISYGKLTPVVAIEHETTSKPVTEKVLDEMRSCFAGVIHIDAEKQLIDSNGEKVTHLNENVLIEIGATMALYGKNIILLVKKGIALPSNLQGLYVCYYESDKLEYESTMKLLKAINEFK